MPLWDLFYFFRSYAVWAARRSGSRGTIEPVANALLGPSALQRVMIDAVDRSCERIGLDPALTWPLFVTCWMHRAVKESTRLAPQRLAAGSYVRLLRRCLQERGSAF